MSVNFFGDFSAKDTVWIAFNTFSSDDPSASVTITDLVAGDVYIHSDGIEGTPGGKTVFLNVGVNGNHLVSIDLSDNTDAGFYSPGSHYQVRMEGTTVDGGTINAWIGTFSIGCSIHPMTTGIVAAAANDSITLTDGTYGATPSAINDTYIDQWCVIVGGTGAGQVRRIDAYTGASRVAEVTPNWTTNPDTASYYQIIQAAQIGTVGTVTTKTGYSVSQTGLDAVLKSTTFALAIADAIWDEVLTGSTHNVSTSAGRRLRQVEAASVHASGVIATVTNGHTFTLDAGAVATADFYVGDRLDIIEGTGAGQSRLIVAYTSGRACTLDSDFTTNPDTSSLYDVVAADVHVSLSDADLAGGFVATYTNTTTITLDSAAVATTDYYKDMMVIFTHGTGAGQSRQITAYTSGRVCTLSPALTTALDTTTSWHITANAGTEKLGGMSTGMKAEVNAEADSALSDWGKTGFTLTNFSDANAAKLEDILDGTGGTGIKVSTIEVTSTTTLTGAVTMPGGLAANITGNITGNLSGSVGDISAAAEDAGLVLVTTTIATLASQTSFTLTAGSTDDSAYIGCIAVVEDVSTAAQKAVGIILAYTGSTKTITLAADPGVFTMAATDKIRILPRPKQEISFGTIVTGTVSHDNTAASTTVFYADDITEATADHFNGRIVIFTSGALQYQASDISDYELEAGEGKFTVTALTEAPADNVTFVIV